MLHVQIKEAVMQPTKILCFLFYFTVLFAEASHCLMCKNKNLDFFFIVSLIFGDAFLILQ